MRRCIIWGTGDDYDRLYNSICFEEYKGNIDIVAAVTKKENIYSKFIDGIPLISSTQLYKFQFDYIIVCSSRFFDEICLEIQDIGIDRSRVLNGSVFAYSKFDFNKYVNLIENPVTIISDDCWGVRYITRFRCRSVHQRSILLGRKMSTQNLFQIYHIT